MIAALAAEADERNRHVVVTLSSCLPTQLGHPFGQPGLLHPQLGHPRLGPRGAGTPVTGLNQIGDRLQHLREMLPCAVRVTAGTHPLNGRTLDALSFIHLRGVLHLVVRLPDSSPGTIPVSATDVFGERAAEGPATVLDADGLRRLRALTLALGGRDGAGR